MLFDTGNGHDLYDTKISTFLDGKSAVDFLLADATSDRLPVSASSTLTVAVHAVSPGLDAVTAAAPISLVGLMAASEDRECLVGPIVGGYRAGAGRHLAGHDPILGRGRERFRACIGCLTGTSTHPGLHLPADERTLVLQTAR